MIESDAQNPTGLPPTIDELHKVALEVLRHILRAYGFEEDKGPPEKEDERDYKVEVIKGDHLLSLDIDANEDLRGILIGKGCATVMAMERILIGALHRRLNLKKDQRLGRAIRLSVNDVRLDSKRGNGDEERKVVTIIAPPGVEVRTLNPDGTNR